MSAPRTPASPEAPAVGAPVFSGDLTVQSVTRDGSIVRLRFPVPDAFRPARAGQFALLSSNRPGSPLLGRPISVVLTDALEFAFAMVGEGTRMLGAAEPGDTLYVTGPLGNAFNAAEDATLIVCDATHFGTFLALGIERQAAGAPADLLYVRSEGEAAALDPPVLSCLRPVVQHVEEVALDGLAAALDALEHAVIAAGARDAVMAALQDRAAQRGWAVEAAVQAPMACGLGVCKVCIRRRTEGGTFLVCETPVVPIAQPVFAL